MAYCLRLLALFFIAVTVQSAVIYRTKRYWHDGGYDPFFGGYSPYYPPHFWHPHHYWPWRHHMYPSYGSPCAAARMMHYYQGAQSPCSAAGSQYGNAQGPAVPGPDAAGTPGSAYTGSYAQDARATSEGYNPSIGMPPSPPESTGTNPYGQDPYGTSSANPGSYNPSSVMSPSAPEAAGTNPYGQYAQETGPVNPGSYDSSGGTPSNNNGYQPEINGSAPNSTPIEYGDSPQQPQDGSAKSGDYSASPSTNQGIEVAPSTDEDATDASGNYLDAAYEAEESQTTQMPTA